MKNIMIDMETLGTTADAVILSIGAVKFDLGSDEIDDAAFYASVSVESNLELKRRISEDTLLWWLKQSAAAQNVFFEPKQTLANALVGLSNWIGEGDYCVWSNGADFDLPMLAHAYTQLGVEIPWQFWNSRCARTYKNLPQAAKATWKQEGPKHNAMVDAVNQVRMVQAIHRELMGKDKVKA